jgi:hypothetical protein
MADAIRLGAPGASGSGGNLALPRFRLTVLGILATRSCHGSEARAVGLPYVEITTDPANIASQRVISANGGVLVEHFTKPPQFGSKPGLRFRIFLS